jgi:hypothetical protein
MSENMENEIFILKNYLKTLSSDIDTRSDGYNLLLNFLKDNGIT